MHSIKDTEEDPKEGWVQVPQSRISFGGVFEAGSASHLFSMSNSTRKQFFYGMNSLKDLEEDLKGDRVEVPQSKNSFWGVFVVWSASHLIQHVKLCTCTNFHACIIKCTMRPFFEVKLLQ